jgi:hypothetical protein
MSTSPVQQGDGVGIVARGNLMVILYAADARLSRTAWVFDRVDEVIARTKGPILVLLIITDDAGPPDVDTRAENLRRYQLVDESILKMVTVPTGDAFRASVVRTIMRTMLLLLRHSSRHTIARTVEDGISEILKEAGPSTPDRRQILADVDALRESRRALVA